MVRSSRPDGRPLSNDAFETSTLLVELLHMWPPRRRADATRGARHPALSPNAIRAAIHLYQRGELTVGDLAKSLRISAGWASRVVEELERSDLVERERLPGDRRVVHLRLKARAVAEVEAVYRWRGEAVDAALEPFDEAERAAIRVFLRRVIDAFVQDDPTDATG